MQVIFLTRRQYDKLCGLLTSNGTVQIAYLNAKKKWKLAGVTITTDSTRLISLLDQVTRR